MGSKFTEKTTRAQHKPETGDKSSTAQNQNEAPRAWQGMLQRVVSQKKADPLLEEAKEKEAENGYKYKHVFEGGQRIKQDEAGSEKSRSLGSRSSRKDIERQSAGSRRSQTSKKSKKSAGGSSKRGKTDRGKGTASPAAPAEKVDSQLTKTKNIFTAKLMDAFPKMI